MEEHMAAGRPERERNVRQGQNVQRNYGGQAPSLRNGSAQEPINHEHQQMLQWFQTVKFRKSMFGGVDERDVWKKLNELNEMYEAALSAERARYDAMLKAYVESAGMTVTDYKQALAAERARSDALRKAIQRMQTQQ